jgi:pimeloyl-ACP methyl ester carboxylesterase
MKDKNKNKPHVFLIHGAGGNPYTLYPLKWFLHLRGFKKTHIIRYDVKKLGLDDALDHVDMEMSKIADKNKDDVILIGQSFGGNIANNLHKVGWKIITGIYIGSPLNGARILDRKFLQGFKTRIHDHLRRKTRSSEPDHEYHTISMGLWISKFDGLIHKDETVLNDDHHSHYNWSFHWGAYLDPRVFIKIDQEINKSINHKMMLEKSEFDEYGNDTNDTNVA